MSLDEFVTLFVQFTDQHYATAAAQPFFRTMHGLCLKGMGVGIGGEVASSGEKAAMNFVQSQLSQKYPDQVWNIFDVGANVGEYTRSAIETFGLQNRRYFCFEPSPTAYPVLRAELAAYPDISLLNFALSDVAQENLPFFGDAAGSSQSSLYSRRLDHYGIAVSQVERISAKTLDGFCEENAIDRVHFLKLDVEGHELKCVQGARGMTQSGRVDFIQFEFGGTNIDARTYFQDFWYELKNYQICRIIRDGLVEILAYREAEEMFGAQNYLACLKG